jgi:hypothetical protein
MKVLFVHQNFPGQYLHVARHLGAVEGNQVVFITQRTDADLPGVRKLVYKNPFQNEKSDRFKVRQQMMQQAIERNAS